MREFFVGFMYVLDLLLPRCVRLLRPVRAPYDSVPVEKYPLVALNVVRGLLLLLSHLRAPLIPDAN
jgi:hypothetical protein